ncbi:MAG: 2-dehydropantoate 2-reductase [Chloroflexota bacterium]
MSKSSLKIAVAGAGSIGCYIGGRLAASGASVTLLLRPWLKEQLDEHGIHISHLHETRDSNPASLSWVTDPACLQTADVILITVKSGATEAIAQTILEYARPKTTVVSLQNGVDNLPKLKRILSNFKVVGGMVPYNVVQLGGGRFKQATAGEVWFGEGGEDVAKTFDQLGLPTRYHDDIEAVHWGKLLLNLNNPIQALSGITLKDELSKREFRMVLAGAIDEALAVYKAVGIEPVAVTKIPVTWLPTALRLPDWIFSRVAKSTLDVDPAAKSSMWEDLQKGRKTEIEQINGVIVRLAVQHSLSVPINKRLVDAIHAAESGGMQVMKAKEMLLGPVDRP